MSSNINILNGDCYENLWFIDRDYPITNNGLTLDYDYDTQIYTLNGTSTKDNNWLLLNDTVDYNFNLGDKYIIKVFYIDGNFNKLSTNSRIFVKMDFMPMNPYQIQIINSVDTKDTDSQIYAIKNDALARNKYMCQVTTWFGSSTFDNYRFRVYFGKVGPTEYIPTVNDIN